MIGDGLSVKKLQNLQNTAQMIGNAVNWLEKELPLVSLKNLYNWKHNNLNNLTKENNTFNKNNCETIEYNIASDDDTTQVTTLDVEQVMKSDQKAVEESNSEAQQDFYNTQNIQNNKQWTDLEDLHIKSLWRLRYSTQWDNGTSKKEIAKSICKHLKQLNFYRSENAVYNRMNKLLFTRNGA